MSSVKPARAAAVDAVRPPSLPDVPPLPRRLVAELLGSGLLAALVIGSGIAAQTLSPTDEGIQLMQNAAATAVGLFALILVFAPVSGAHFNPVVTLVDAVFGGTRWRDALAYLPAQVVGCCLGALLANAMFGQAVLQISTKERVTAPHLLAEVVATFGLIMVVFALIRTGRGGIAPAAVGAYIGAAYWFTSSTSFANPAITVGRVLSDTFAGIAPTSAPGYVLAQLIGGAIALVVVGGLYPRPTDSAAEVPRSASGRAVRPRGTRP